MDHKWTIMGIVNGTMMDENSQWIRIGFATAADPLSQTNAATQGP